MADMRHFNEDSAEALIDAIRTNDASRFVCANAQVENEIKT